MKSAFALMAFGAAVSTLALTSPTNIAQAGKPQNGCVTLEVAVDPIVASAGDPVTASGAVANCESRKDRVTLDLTLDGPGGLGMVFGQTSFHLNPDEERSISVTVEIPAQVPAGIYTATAEAISRRGGYAVDSVTLTID